MKLFKLMFIGLVSASLFVAGCSKNEETTTDSGTTTAAATAGGSTSAASYDTATAYTPTNTPSSTKVSVPDTLSSSSSSTARTTSRMSQLRTVADKGADAEAKGENDAMSLSISQSVVGAMKRTSSQADMSMIFLDAAIAGGTVKLADSATTGCQEPGEVKFIMTAEMAKAIMERSSKDYGMSEEDVAQDMAWVKEMIGKEQSGPAIHYYSDTVMGVAGKVLAVGQDTRSEDGSTGSVSACDSGKIDKPSELIKWSDDKTKLDYKGFFPNDKGEITTVTMTYDDTNKISAFEMKGKGDDGNRFTFGGKFRECNATAGNNCVDFKVFAKFMDAQGSGQIKTQGRADNDGGFAKGKLAFQETGGNTFNAWMKEYFDGSGTLTGLKFANDTSADCFTNDAACTWVTAKGSNNNDSYEGGAEDTNPDGKKMTLTYGKTFPASTADDGEYAIVPTGTTISVESVVGFIGVENGAILEYDFFMPPSNGDTGDLYKVNSYDESTGEATFSAQVTTVTVTLQ